MHPSLNAIVLTAVLTSGIHAATIIQPNTPTSNLGAGDAGSTLAGLVDGAGLTNTLVTGTDTTTALTTTHGNDTASQNWVTAPTGSDYFVAGAIPVFTFALGGTFNNIDSIIVWNYARGAGSGNAPNNALRTFSLEFFSDAAATNSLGSVTNLSVARSNPTTGTSAAVQVAQQIAFGSDFDGVQAIKMSLTDNYFGSAGGAGGDRVGFAEVRFSSVPEPSSSLAFLGLAGLGLAIRRRR